VRQKMKFNIQNKKAQGLSMNTIIIAVIGLLILVILALVFSGKITTTREGIEDVEKTADITKCEIPGVRTCTESAKCARELGQYSASCPQGKLCCAYEDLK